MSEEDSHAAAKAKAFFDKAAKVAETDNFDYAIDMYLQGLRYAPDALHEGHLPLCELALQRQGKNGKKPGVVEKMTRLRGKTPLEQLPDRQRFAKSIGPDLHPAQRCLLHPDPVRQGHRRLPACSQAQTG
ncbi:MAG: hypothetical protein ACYS74_21840 [Planctomycetota bacterium]|jgi:hypothetical protein